MHRIDTPTAQVDKFGAGKNGFTGGNPQTGELPTALDASFFDSVQEEISGVIEAAGLKLIKEKNDQLLNAINLLVSSGRLMNIRVYTVSGSYSPTTGTKKIKVYVTGAGGGGGGSAATDSSTRSCGGGGGSGSTVVSTYNIADITLPLSITVGTAGSGGAAGGAIGGNGGNGGATLFGSLITAAGGFGAGGGGQATDSGSIVNANGGGNAASTGGNLLTMRGAPGLPGITSNVGNVSGSGGSSFFCGGGNPISSSTSTNGDSGTYGSGGSGGMSVKATSVGKPGGAGGAGIVIIEEYA